MLELKKQEKEINNRSFQTLKARCVCVFVFDRSENCFKPSYSDARKMCLQLLYLTEICELYFSSREKHFINFLSQDGYKRAQLLLVRGKSYQQFLHVELNLPKSYNEDYAFIYIIQNFLRIISWYPDLLTVFLTDVPLARKHWINNYLNLHHFALVEHTGHRPLKVDNSLSPQKLSSSLTKDRTEPCTDQMNDFPQVIYYSRTV